MKLFPKLILILLIILVYGNTLLSSFHFDDIPSILEKPWIRGWDKIPQFIFSIFQRPLVILSFNINYSISEFQVWSYHIFNICFHIIATLLVYSLVHQISFFLKDISKKKQQLCWFNGFFLCIDFCSSSFKYTICNLYI